MAVDQGAAVAATTALATGILGVAVHPPMSPQDFGWFSAFALWGILAKHASNAAKDRADAKAAHQPRNEWPTLDWLAFVYDAMTAPLLGVIGWSISYYTVMWLWKVQLDKSVLLPAAMASGFIGAEWVRFAWMQIRGLVSSKTGVSQ